MKEEFIRIRNILNENLGKEEITIEQIDDDLMQLGVDSIIFIQIVVALEEEFGVEIPDECLLMTQMNTISKIADVLAIAKVQE